jgi:hypothetical protein
MQPEIQWLLIGQEKPTKTTRVQLEVLYGPQYDVYYRLKKDVCNRKKSIWTDPTVKINSILSVLL